MTDYNFGKNYENIKLWKYKEQTIDFSAEKNIFDQFLNILKSYPETFLLIKSKKILYIPTSFVLAAVGIVEITSIFPIINIKRLENAHFEYEEKVNALNTLNQDREENFNLLKNHSSLLTNPSPSYLFGYYLQKSIPENVQLTNYIVDNSGFRIDAISTDLISANKLISLLLENKLIDNKSMKINKIVNQVNNSESSIIGNSSPQIDSISIVISGDLVYLPLEDRIQSHKVSKDYGNLEKLTNFYELLELIR